ncbi:MAG: hypothetical protein LR015_11335 [Verrucomicrobia bacterium]|nr:hypothetical protein [Verrucomicrobiota bacterium]
MGAWQLSATSSNELYGWVDGAGEYADGDEFSLSAIPLPGYRFVGWQELENNVSNPLVGVVTDNLNFTALFEAIPPSVNDLPGEVVTLSPDLAFSSVFGWVFHADYPWIYLPHWGWCLSYPSWGMGGQVMNLIDHGWIWVPESSAGDFYNIAQDQWGSFPDFP